MADKTRSDSDAARSKRGILSVKIKRGTLSIKTKRKPPFVLEFFLSHTDGEGLKRNIERIK